MTINTIKDTPAADTLEPQSKFDVFRKGFPAFENSIYFSICYRAILHKAVRTAINDYLDHFSCSQAPQLAHDEVVASSRRRFARLVNADPSWIAVIRSVADGINTIMWSLPFQEGDNVVLCLAHEHPSNIYPWKRLAQKGVVVKNIPLQPDGQLDIEAMIDAIDANTKVMTCASVSYAPGHRVDLARLGEACRKRDIFFLVDAIQSVGILQHDVQAEYIDGLVTATSKGLLGLYTYGFMSIAPQWIDRMMPTCLSQAAIDIDACCHSVSESQAYYLWPDSRRFEVTGYNYAAAYAADEALDLLLELGPSHIEKHVLSLVSQMHDGISDLGLTTLLARDGASQSSLLTLGDICADTTEVPAKIQRISNHLNEGEIIHSIRRGQLRFGFHAYNNEQDVTSTLLCIKEAVS
ncbi:MAG: aminotransferase class V-fold PLP-dependent enzyme [Pseudomonadota bacterium]